jgi:hypothetical protein
VSNQAAFARINIATYTVTYIGVSTSVTYTNMIITDLRTIYEDPYYQGGNFVAVVQAGTSTSFSQFMILKIDLNDTMTYPTNT